MLRFGIPLIPAHIGNYIVNMSDRYFIKEYVSIADAGLYSLGYRFGILPGIFVSEPFNAIWRPRRLEVYKQDGAEYIFGRIFTYFLVVAVLSLPLPRRWRPFSSLSGERRSVISQVRAATHNVMPYVFLG